MFSISKNENITKKIPSHYQSLSCYLILSATGRVQCLLRLCVASGGVGCRLFSRRTANSGTPLYLGMAFFMIGQSALYWFAETHAKGRHSTQGALSQIGKCFTNEHQRTYCGWQTKQLNTNQMFASIHRGSS